MVMLSSRGTSTDWRNGLTCEVNKRNCKVLHLGRNNPMYQYTLGANWLESSFAEKDLGLPVDDKLNIKQQPAGQGR